MALISPNSRITPIIYPPVDSTSAIQLNKADGTTNILVVDTTNSRIGVNTATPKGTFHIYCAATADVATTYGVDVVGGTDGLNFGYGGNSFGAGQSFFNAHSATAGNGILRLMVNAVTKILIQNDGNVAIGNMTATAVLHLKAGTATASTAPLKMESGTKLTTAEAGVIEYNGNHLLSNVALRYPVGGVLFDQYADASVGGAETTIYTNTLAANTFNGNGDKVTASYGGNFVTIGTESVQLKVYLAGTAIWDSTAIAVTTGTTSWAVSVEFIRVSATVVRYIVRLNTSGASGFVYNTVGELTGLTLSGTNILKLTGTSSGVGSGVGDIIGKMGYVEFKPAA